MRFIVVFLMMVVCASIVGLFSEWYYAPLFGLISGFLAIVFVGMIFFPHMGSSSTFDDRSAPIYRNGHRIN